MKNFALKNHLTKKTMANHGQITGSTKLKKKLMVRISSLNRMMNILP